MLDSHVWHLSCPFYSNREVGLRNLKKAKVKAVQAYNWQDATITAFKWTEPARFKERRNRLHYG